MIQGARKLLAIGLDSSGVPRSLLVSPTGELQPASGVVTYHVTFHGDSITVGSMGSCTDENEDCATSYPGVAMANLVGSTRTNLGIPGAGVASDYPGGATLNMVIMEAVFGDVAFDSSKDVNIACVFAGTNDMSFNPPTTQHVFDELKAYCLARRAMGSKVICVTCAPRGDGFTNVTEANMEIARQAYNTLIRNDTSFYDAIVDVGADPTIGDDGDEDNTTYYADKVHFTDAGYAIVGGLAKTAIQSITTPLAPVVSARRGLIADWTLNEVSGNRADSSLLTGAPTALLPQTLTDDSSVGSAATGAPDGTRCARLVLASTDSFSRADHSLISMASNISFEGETWIKLTTKATDQYMISKINNPFVDGRSFEYAVTYGPTPDRYSVVVGNGAISGAATADVFGSPPTGAWHCIQWWLDIVNSLVGIRVNGGIANTTAYAGGSQDGNGILRVGAFDFNGSPIFQVDGDMWKTRLWKGRNLTTAERDANYNGGQGRNLWA